MFIRNLIGLKKLEPPPETVFLITPQSDMLSREELLSWSAQCSEGLYKAESGSLIPLTKRLAPNFKCLNFREAFLPVNLDVDNDGNIFRQAAENGAVCIVIDECMGPLSEARNLSAFFHALPSKIFTKCPQCTGYYVIVVLHNMNPRHDRGNIADLKAQAKIHIISPTVARDKINRFLNTVSTGIPNALLPLLKDVFEHARRKHFTWILYNCCPPLDSFRWSLYEDGMLNPLLFDLQSIMFNTVNEACKLFKKRKLAQALYAKRQRVIDEAEDCYL